MGHLIPVDPGDVTVIDVGDLEHRVDLRISCAPFAEDHLSHPPVVVEPMCNLLCCLDDDVITWLDAEKCWWPGPFERGDSRRQMVNAH